MPNLITLRTHIADELEVSVVAASAEHRGVVHLKTEEGVQEREAGNEVWDRQATRPRIGRQLGLGSAGIQVSKRRNAEKQQKEQEEDFDGGKFHHFIPS